MAPVLVLYPRLINGREWLRPSALRVVVGGRKWFSSKDMHSKWRSLLISLLMWHWSSGCDVSLRFVTYVYLKCQLDLDTCHLLNAPRVLASWLWSSGHWVKLHVLNPFSLKWSAPKLTTIWLAYLDPSVIMHCPNLMVLIHFSLRVILPVLGFFLSEWSTSELTPATQPWSDGYHWSQSAP